MSYILSIYATSSNALSTTASGPPQQSVQQLNGYYPNVFCVMPDSEFEENTNGNTSSGVFVRIKESKSMSDTGPHEDGHTLGMTHSFQGIMTAASSDPNRSYTVDKKNLKKMILAPLTGKNNSEDNMPIGKGSVKNMSGYTIDELKNGKIKTKK